MPPGTVWVSREEKRRLDQYSPVISRLPFGAALANLLDRIGSALEEAPAATTRLYPQNPANEVVDRWYIAGDWKLTGITAYAVDGVSVSALGVYELKVYRVNDGVETLLDTFDLETLANQTVTEFALSMEHQFSEGEILMLACDSDNADLTGGSGISITPKFGRR